MQTEAAILWGQNQPWSVETIELDPPKAGEVLVKVAAVGLNFPDILLCQGRYQIRPPLPFTSVSTTSKTSPARMRMPVSS